MEVNDSLSRLYDAAKTETRFTNAEFKLVEDDLNIIYENQGRVCAMSGLPIQDFDDVELILPRGENYYTTANSKLVHKSVLKLMGDMDETAFKKLCFAIGTHVPLDSPNKWDMKFMMKAKLASNSSKDPSTKVGAVIATADRRLVSEGYNGFPQCMEDVQEHYENRDEKYSRIIHGEVNALLFAGKPVDGCTLYTYPFAPCDRCCVQMLQAGIKRFVFPALPEYLKERWGNSIERTKRYIVESGATYTELDFRI